MADLDLFPADESKRALDTEHESGPGMNAPLAARMRPRTLSEFRGQEHLLGEGRAIRAMLDQSSPKSMILWGPPGSGKTTLARLIAAETEVTFVPLSAVSEGIARVREIIEEASTRLQSTGRRTILFCDEIHRFNKAQQDAFLPHVEAGTVILIGATTENPSFRIRHSDILRGHADQPPRDVERIFSTVDHAGQPIESPIRVASPDRLVKR